jgi:hypothetical protein
MAERRIWKIPLTDDSGRPRAVGERLHVPLPGPGRVVHFGVDGNDRLCAWIEMTPGAASSIVFLHVVGTGHPLPAQSEHCGTVVMRDGLVWHLRRLIDG